MAHWGYDCVHLNQGCADVATFWQKLNEGTERWAIGLAWLYLVFTETKCWGKGDPGSSRFPLSHTQRGTMRKPSGTFIHDIYWLMIVIILGLYLMAFFFILLVYSQMPGNSDPITTTKSPKWPNDLQKSLFLLIGCQNDSFSVKQFSNRLYLISTQYLVLMSFMTPVRRAALSKTDCCQ